MPPDRRHVEELKIAADGPRVAAALGLRKKGTRYFCPVCQAGGGKTPDMVIRNRGFWGFFCHKCKSKGDMLTLVMAARRVDFSSALAWLEDLTGCRRKPARPGPGRAAGAIPGPPSRPGPGAPATGANPAVYEAFLEACRPVDGAVLSWLKGKVPNMTDALVKSLRLAFCGREYPDIMRDLTSRFGEDELLTAGLLKRSKAGRAVPTFWHYYAKKAGFLVVPYMVRGRPVFLKVRPPVPREQAERLGLVRFLNTAAAVPCLYNVDALTAEPRPDRVLVCEGESDTWAALSAGWTAVGSPGARAFKEAWAPLFQGFLDSKGRSTVYLVMDADRAGEDGTRVIADLFLLAGLPVPLKIAVPVGKDLCEYIGKEGEP